MLRNQLDLNTNLFALSYSYMNKELKKIFDYDQKDRFNLIIRNNSKLLTENDAERRKMVDELIHKKEFLSAKDYFFVAMIFHHGPSIKDSMKAVKFSETSHELGYKKALPFYATCLDRLLIKKGKKQKFGTQYRRKDDQSEWRLLPVDSNTTDDERKKYKIAPFKKLIRNVEKLNNKS